MQTSSIFKRIRFLQIITLLSALVGIFIIVFTLFKSYLEDNTTQYLDNFSKTIESSIAFNVKILSKELMTLSKDKFIERYNINYAEAIIAKFLTDNKDAFSVLSYLDEEGTAIEKIKYGVLSNDLYFNKKDKTYIESFKTPNKVLIAPIKYNADLQTNSLEFIINIKSYFGNQFKGILVGAIPSGKFIKIPKSDIEKGLIVRVVDKTNKILYSSNSEKSDKNIKNSNDIIVKTAIFNGDYNLVVSYPYTVVSDTLYQSIFVVGILFLIIFIITFYMGNRLIQTISVPLNELVQGINNVSKGDLTYQIKIPKEIELQTIAHSFNKMTKEIEYSKLQLETLNNSLELKVTNQITSLRDKDKMLAQQSKMAAMGEMTDAIAHQWKQPLSIIKTISTSIELNFKCKIQVSDEDMRKYLENITSQVDHLDETINEFRNFFRPNPKLENSSLHKLIKSTLTLMNDHLVQNNITTDINIDDTISVDVIPSEFKHILINLINNAKDAFIDNKTKEPKIIFAVQSSHNNIVLNITDNAGGIPEDIIDEIFSSNFTTKTNDKGTGIGLYMSRQIIEKIKGTINVSNTTLEDGTTGASFEIILNKADDLST